MLGFETSRRLMAALILFLLASPAAVQGQAPSPVPTAGTETLTYDIEWRLITAGTAKVERSAKQISLRLTSVGLVSKLYKIDDLYTVNYEGGLCATSLHQKAQEGRRKRDTKVTYDRTHNRADYLERDLIKNTVVKQSQIDVPHCVHDVIGALAALRTARVDAGKSTELPVSDGKKSASVRVEAQEREEVKVKGKVLKTIRYEAFLFNNVIYARKARLMLWLTDDARKLPVKLELRMSFPIGTVTLMLDKEEYR